MTITEITNYFDSKMKYLHRPPQKWDLEQVLKYIEQDDYNQLMFNYGEIYCLIVLDMFEKREEYETCSEILKQIETHNVVTGSTFRSSLRELNGNEN